MKRNIALIVLLSVLACGCSTNTEKPQQENQTNTSAEEGEILHYENTDLGVELDYPAGWEPVEEDSQVTFYYEYNEASGTATAYVNLTVADVAEEQASLEDIKDEMVENLTTDGGMSVDNVEPITVSGNMPAYKLALSNQNSSGTTVKFSRMVATDYGYLYLLTYSARQQDFDKLQSAYDTMLSSFKVITFTMDSEGNITPNE